MKYDELIDLTQNILQANYLSVYRIEPSCENFEHLDLGLRSNILNQKDASDSFRELFQRAQPGRIYFNTDLFRCTFVYLLLPDEKTIFYCGPVLFEKIQGERFDEVFASVELPEELKEPLRHYYQRLPFQASYAMFESLFLELGKAMYKEKCEVIYSNADFFDRWENTGKDCNQDTEHPFSNIDVIEARYESENMLMGAVSSGRKSRALEMTSRFGTFYLPQRTTNTLRDVKDYTITMNTLLRKAAEHAGVHPVHIDSYSNHNVSTLEKLTSVEQVFEYQRKIVLGYCNIVKEHQHKVHSPLLKKVLAYVETDLSADLTLKTLSDHLGVNASYLSTLFSREMGTSLTDYVTNLRISHAKTLLTKTNAPIKSIAERCGIGDIHYFTRLFKRTCGMTPNAYRKSPETLDTEN